MNLPRIYNRAAQHVVDLIILAFAFIFSYILRFEGVPTGLAFKHMLFQWPYVVLLTMGAYFLTGVYRYVWRYISLNEIKGFALAHSIIGTLLLIARFSLPDRFHYAIIPISVIAINGLLAFIGSVGVRALYRLITERGARRKREAIDIEEERKRVLLIGAGRAGLLTARELSDRTDLGLKPVGFVDDDPIKLGQVICGLKVLGSVDKIPEIVTSLKVEILLIAIAAASGPQVRRIKKICDLTKLPTKILPGIYELIGGAVSISRIRDVEIEDLLGREVVHLDDESIGRFLRGKTVIITGAGGSIGSEMCRQVCRYKPTRLLLVEQAESPLFDTHRQLEAIESAPQLIPLIGDICDSTRMRQIFEDYHPQVVIHAAAHKHVPMMEWNPGEAIKNNVFGTKKLADIAVAIGVERFIMISTDKAVHPTSVMGASKRIAEMYLQMLAQGSGPTKFIAVRFGNVLGSVGSVIPIFKEQIRRGGPITITHPDMQRYFMTIPEASQLVLQAAAMGAGGEVFVLDMGSPVKILDLAKDLIRLSNFREDEIEIIFTGLRPGEKLFEEISLSCEHFTKTLHDKIFIGKLAPVNGRDLLINLELLHQLTDGRERQVIMQCLKTIIQDYSPEKAILLEEF